MATDSIEVAIRVRPLIRRENEAAQKKHWRVTDNTITQLVNGKPLPTSQFTFDHVFDESVVTKDIYKTFAKPKIMSALLGFNATIFAYGQTSSGKTHTMIGNRQSPGIIPHVINDIFEYMNEDYNREYLLVVTYMEIYNENITDLLNPNNKNLKIHENSKKEVFVGDITQHPVSGSNQVFALMSEGEKNRHFGETNMNDKSSRSHTIFCIHIESRERVVSGDESGEAEDNGAVRVSQLNLVDLAGSERLSQTGAEGQRLKEGAHINKSLFTLGTVIAKLSEGESFHVPFRDSKLTRILQSSLGGNAKTAILCTITPVSIEESNSTLKFASRAKTIKNCPLVNEVLDDGAMLKRMKKEIRDLKQQLTHMQDNTCISELQTEKEKYQKQLEEQRDKYERQIQNLAQSFFTPARLNESLPFNNTTVKSKISKRNPRRETWCPGAMLSKNPLAAAAEVAQSVFAVEYDQPSIISEEPEEIPMEYKLPNDESKVDVDVEILRSDNIALRNKIDTIIAERDQLIEELDDARNDSVSIQKQAFTEAQEMIYNHKEQIEMENMELYEKVKETETKNDELVEECDELKNQLLTYTDKANEADLKIESLSLQMTDLKTYINELSDENLQQKEDLQKKASHIEDLETRLTELQKPNSIPSRDDEVNNLNDDIKELQIRLKKKTTSYDELVSENQTNNEQSSIELEILKLQIATDATKYQKVEEELSGLKTQFEDLFYQYDELRMALNFKESEIEDLKSENIQLQAHISSGMNDEKIDNRRSFKRDERNISGESLDENNAITSLNLTLQTKCEELEEMTFLYDERELEIIEVRDSLEEFHNKRTNMEDTLAKKTAQIEELQSEIECLMEELLKAKSVQSEMDNQFVELRHIIKEQEAEMIKLGEKLKSTQLSYNESSKVKNKLEFSEKENEVEELKQIIKEQEAKIIKLQSDAQDASKLAEMLCSLEQLQTDLQKATNDKEELSYKNVDLQAVILKKEEDSTNEVQTLQDEQEELKSQLGSSRKQNEELNNKLEQADVKIENLRRVINDQEEDMFSTESQKEELEKELEKLRQKLENQDGLEGLKNEIQILKGEKEGVKSQLESVQKHNNELNEMMRQKLENGNGTDGLKNEIQVLQDEQEELQSELVSSRQQNEELNNKLEQANAKIENLRRVINDQEEDMFSTESQKEELEKELEKLRQKFENQDGLEGLKNEIQILKGEKEELKSQLETAQQGNKEFEDCLESLQKEIQVLQDEKVGIKSQLESVQKHNDELNEMMRQKLENRNGTDSLKNEIQVLQDEQELKSQLASTRQQNEELNNKLEQADAKIENLQRVINDQEEDMFSTGSQKEQLEKELQTLRQKLENQDGLEGLKDEIQILKSEKEELKSQLETAQQGNKEFEDGLESLQKEIQVLQDEKEGVKSQLESVQKHNDELNEMMRQKLENRNGTDGLKNEIQVLQDEQEELKSQLESARHQNEELNNKLEQADAKIENLRRVINDQEEDMFNTESQKEELEKELKTLRQKLENECSLEEGRKKLDLQEQLDNALQTIQSSGEKEFEYQTKMTHLTQELDELVKEKQLYQQQSKDHIMAKQAELEDLQDQMIKNREENQKLRDSIHRQRKQISEMQDILMDKEQGRASQEKNIDVLQNEINELKKVNTELDELVKENQLHQQKSEDHIMAKQAELEDLQDQMIKNSEENQNLRNSIHRQRKQISEMQEGSASQENIDIWQNEINELKKVNTDLQVRLHSVEAEHVKLQNQTETQKRNYDCARRQVMAYEEELSTAKAYHFTEIERLKKTIDEQDKLIEDVKNADTEQTSNEKLTEALEQIKNLQNLLADSQSECSHLEDELVINSDVLVEKMSQLESAEKKLLSNEVSFEKLLKRIDELKNRVDEQRGEINEANNKIQQLEAGGSISQDVMTKIIPLQEQNRELQETIQLNTQTLEEQTNKLEEAEKNMDHMYENIKRLRNIIDEQQDEIDEAVKNNEQLQDETKNNEKKLQETSVEVERLNQILKASEHDQVETLRIEIAGKNMKIQELEYKAFKTEEEMNRLRREVQFGYSKMSKLKEDMRRLREEAVRDDTIPIERNVPCSSESDVGVVSSVAVYSLKAKLGELEKENQKLKDKTKQLEKDKVTLSLFKTDASNRASKLSDEVQFLRKQIKDLTKQYRVLKGKEDQPDPQQHVLAPSNPPDEGSSANHQEPSMADRCRASMVRERENRPASSNWLSPSKTRDMFKDKANQCPQQ